MSLQIIRIAGIIIGGTLGGYISGKIGEYIYNKKNKIPQIENKIDIIVSPVLSSDDKKIIKSFEDLFNKEIKNYSNQSNPKNNNNESILGCESESKNYFQEYL